MLALLVSGWSGTLAAALCPHAGMNQALPLTKEDACHGKKLETTGNHHQQHQGGHGESAQAAETKAVINLQLEADGEAAIGQPAGNCTHCMGQSRLPLASASVRELILQKQDAGQSIVNETETTTLPTVAVSVSLFVPSQHAPPGRAVRQHLILGVFLI